MLNFFLPWRWKRRINPVLDAKFNATRNSIVATLDESLSAAIAEARHSLSASVNEAKSELAEQSARLLADLQARLDAVAKNLSYLVTTLNDTRVMLLNVDAAAQTRFNTLENAVLPELSEQTHEVIARQVRATASHADLSHRRTHAEECYAPANPEPFDVYLARASD